MRCPFLREAQVKSCQASAYRKMIAREPGGQEAGRCSSAEYITCPAAKQHHEENPSLDHCPFLQESLVQYCAAASVVKYIPYSESSLSPCGTASHRFCDLYHEIASPDCGSEMTADRQECADEHDVEGVRMPGWLWYSPNHLWLDVGADGVLHVGIDAFLAGLLGEIDRLTFVTPRGLHYPTAVISVQGMDLQIVFPKQITVTKPNAYLRLNPGKLLTHPYSLGWLFEGTAPRQLPTVKETSMLDGLISGDDACTWMRNERQRMNTLVHALAGRADHNGMRTMADGGAAAGSLFLHLNREEVLLVFSEFFSPFARKRPTP